MRVPLRFASVVAVSAVTFLAVPTVAHAAYGAIAINPRTGAYGVSFDFATLGAAKRRAQRECAGNCRILVWVRNGCAAVVETPTRYVPGVGRTRRRAVLNARRRARAPRARRVAWTCSG